MILNQPLGKWIFSEDCKSQFCNWFVTPDVFDELGVRRRWGEALLDRFILEKNWKTTKSKYICPKTVGVNAFTFDWAGTKLSIACFKYQRQNCEKFSLINNIMQF